MIIIPKPRINPIPSIPFKSSCNFHQFMNYKPKFIIQSYMFNKTMTQYHHITNNSSKHEKNNNSNITPSGSLPAARQIICKPRNWVQPHVRLAAVHAPLGSFWKNPENANQTRIERFHSSSMTQNIIFIRFRI